MSEYIVQDTTLTAIADAVRAKKGTTEPIALTDLATEIESIQSGGGSGNDIFLSSVRQTTPYEIDVEDLRGISEIGASAFEGDKALERITIPKEVTKIGEEAFYGCVNLKTVIFEDGSSLKEIGSNAFYDCRLLEDIIIPGGTTVFGYQCFSYCYKLQNIIIPEGTTSIAPRMFIGCTNLRNIILPETIVEIGEYAFCNCDSLNQIKLPSKIRIIDNSTFYYSGLTSIFIPKFVTRIGQEAFRGCKNLSEIIFESEGILLEISQSAFSGCSSLKNIDIPYGVTKIGEQCFYNPNSSTERGLIRIVFPETLISIASNSFSGQYCIAEIYNKSKLDVSNIGTTTTRRYTPSDGESAVTTTEDGFVVLTTDTDKILVDYVGENNFLRIPEGITSINQYVFVSNKELLGIVVPSTLTSIGTNAFYYADNLKFVFNASSLNIVKGKTTFGRIAEKAKYVYESTAQSEFQMLENGMLVLVNGDTDKQIVDYSKDERDIVIPEGITKINSYSFYDKDLSVLRIVLPSTLSQIEDYSFGNYAKLVEIYNQSNISIDKGYGFGGIATNALHIYRYGDSLIETDDKGFVTISIDGEKYLVDYVGEDKEIVIPGGITNIRAAFINTDIKGVIVPDTVNIVGNRAFANCETLESVILPDGLVGIENAAFSDCKSLSRIDVPSSVSYIWSGAFSGSGLTEFTIPSTLDELSYRIFSGCKSLKSIVIPSNIKTINSECFEDCESLTNVVIEEGVEEIMNSAFSGCSSLTNILIPNSVITLENYVFDDCTNLTDIQFGENSLLTEIWSRTFGVNLYNVSYLTNNDLLKRYRITIPSNVTSISSDAFYKNYHLAEIYNKSSVNITLGSGAGQYAVRIYGPEDTGSNLYTDDNGFVIVDGDEPNTKFLIDYVGSASDIIIPEGITHIHSYAFWTNLNINSIVLPSTVIDIGDYAFYRCRNLIEVSFNDEDNSALSTIGAYAFYGCSGLQKIIIPKTVSSIGNYAFGYLDCEFVLKGETPPTIVSSTFYYSSNSYSRRIFIVPYENKETYLSATNWTGLKQFIYSFKNTIE